jgi:HrpA-like RNA helicase
VKDFSKIQLVKDLPISNFEEQIAEKLMHSSNLIVIGETGSGKTTQIPLIILKNLSQIQDLARGKIIITEPRRLAATSVARYVSSLIGDELGQTVGYKIRFEEQVSDDTNVIFMTDGILLREAQLDPLLTHYSVVMVDEAHERNINSDFLIGLLVDVQKQRLEKGLVPLKILVTSATLEKDKFINFFEALPNQPLDVIEVPGRLFPIETIYEDRDIWNYEERAAEVVEEICLNDKSSNSQSSINNPSSNVGDILIFMPGKGEIERTKQSIEDLRNFKDLNLDIITVHADLPIEEQNRIFKQTSQRKVVIATNIAETSLTVPGIIYVIDSGLIKVMEFDPHSGINSLVTKPHAKKGLEQRKGRAGRIEPGVYFALYTEKSFNSRPEFPIPEILRSSLSQIILVMKMLGIEDIRDFKFIDHPDDHNINAALVELKRLGALDQDETITEKGIKMVSLPMEPILSNLIIEANKNNCVQQICTIAAFLELKPVILNLTIEDIFKKLVNEKLKELHEPTEVENQDTSYLAQKLPKNELVALENEAERIYADYEVKKKNLEYKGSDFFTLLKIFNLWQEHEMRPEWAESQFLSSETLDEATNIREELLQIASENNISVKDNLGFDLNQRVERTLISAFKFNLLAVDFNGLYRNLKSKEKNIRVHNSSVLFDEKPQFAIAFEVIEISNIDSKPKLSAKFLHEISEKTMRAYFHDIFKSNSRHEKQERRNRLSQRNRSGTDRRRGRRRR